ncbi:hypothetical protein V8E53_008054 [Lactarius tabidus]
MSACSNNYIPTTPLKSDDDEWPGPNLSPNSSLQPQLRKAPAVQRMKIHLLVISKPVTTAPPNASSATALEFTLADLEEERMDKDEMLWYVREISQTLLFPMPPSSGSGKTSRCRMSKPLPALPGPNPQLDPTFPCRRQALPPPVPNMTTPSVRKSLKITVLRAPRDWQG